MITISEEILLLVMDYDTGRLNAELPRRCVRAALGGAVLMDLADRNRVDTDLHRLFVVSPEPLREPVLDRALARIVRETERRPADHWVGVLADDHEVLRSLLADRLVTRGIALRDRFERLLVVGSPRDAINGEALPRDVRRRIAGVLLSDEIPDPRDIMIISLVDSCSLWRGLIDEAGLVRFAPKIRQIARMDLIAQAVARVVLQEP